MNDTPQRKPFAQLIQEQRAGSLHDEASDAMNELVRACQETGKKGSLTLKLNVTPTGDGVTVSVTDDVKIAAPKPDAKPAVFYCDEYGNLLRRDPRQEELALKEVQGGKADDEAPEALKEVAV